MQRTTMSLKVSKRFLIEFRKFCDTRALSIGKFTEMQLTEIMEDYHFGLKAEQVLAKGDSRRKTLRDVTRASK